MGTERKNGRQETSTQLERQSPALKAWIVKEVTVVAELWREPVTPELLRLYAEHLADISHRRLAPAFRLIRETRKRIEGFPTIGDIREKAMAIDVPEAYERPRLSDGDVPATKEDIARLMAAIKKCGKSMPEGA